MSVRQLLPAPRLAAALLPHCASHQLRDRSLWRQCFRAGQRHPPPAASTCGSRLRSGFADSEAPRQPWQGDALHTDRHRPCRSVRVAAAARDKLLKGVDLEFRDDVAQVVEAAERAGDSWQPAVTDFQPPPVVALAGVAVAQLAGIGCVAWGGYPQAERCRMLVGPADTLPLAPNPDDVEFAAPPALSDAVAALEVAGNFMFDAATHRDFLGAVLGTGIDRSKVGDILVLGDRGAQLLVAPQLADFLCEALTSVRSVSVQPRQIPLSELRVPAPRLERRTSIEASLRLDALASAGFRMSRSAMTDLIKKGDVRVNWRPAKASAVLKAGDVVSCAGKGRLEIAEVSETKKGKFAVELARRV